MFKTKILQKTGHHFPLGRKICFALAACSMFHFAHAHADGCDDAFGDKPSQLFLSPSVPSSKPANATSHILDKTYFVYTDEFADGTFESIIKELPHLKEIGIEIVWVSPLHPQTTKEYRGTKNNHRYWVSDYFQVDPLIGGISAYRALIAAGAAHGIRIMLDVVADHCGYGNCLHVKYTADDGTVVDEVWDTKDPTYFRQEFIPDGFYDRLNAATEPHTILPLLDELSRYQWDKDLPVFNHRNEKVFQLLYHAYRDLVDEGETEIRMDASKHMHMPMNFQVRLINALNAHSVKKFGRNMSFLFEYQFYNYQSLDTVTKDILPNVTGAKVYLFDFPLAGMVREAFGRSFYDLKGDILWRQHPSRPLNHYVPLLQDHDFLTRMPHKRSLFSHLLSDMLSKNPTVLYHGAEIGGHKEAREWIAGVDVTGEVGQATKKMKELMEPFHLSPDFHNVHVLMVNHNQILLEKSIDKHGVLLFMQKGHGEMEETMHLPRGVKAGDLEVAIKYLANDNSAIEVVQEADDRIRIKANGPSLVVLKVKYQ
jgi:glycosidase